jgi:hypothetical protein
MDMNKKFMIFLVFAILAIVLCSPVSASNNEKTRYKAVSSSDMSDIVISNIKAPSVIFKGGNITISNTIKNQGKKSCSGFYVEFFFKSNNNSKKCYIGTRYINGLNAGASNSQNSTFRVPSNITGTGYIMVFADSTNKIVESNKTNNIKYTLDKTNIITARPVYITSDNIKNTTADNAKIDKIVKALKSMGLYAVNYGLGPNKHYSVLKNVKIPSTALIVNIYGGACAGTIWEMTKPYYKKALGSRKVFSIWINTDVDVGTVKFLKRSSDDNYTPSYGKSGGFPQFNDTNKNGIFEPNLGEHDGVANPGNLLIVNGYHFIYLKNGDVNILSRAIFNEATSS